MKPAKGFAALVIYSLAAMIGHNNLTAQLRIPFTSRVSPIQPYPNQEVYHIRGDFTILGNKNLTHLNPTSDSNSGEMIYVDVDGDPTTVNSSAATMLFSNENNAIPQCSNIVYAGLYWTGRSHDNPGPNTFQVTNPLTGASVTLDKGRVKIRHQDAPGYTTINAPHANYTQNIYFPTSLDGNMYSAYADITTYVQQYGIGEYTVADIALRQGNGGGVGYYGGWGMVVVYENSRMKWRDISIFDGHAYIIATNPGQENSEIFDVSGFQAVQHGPVNVKLGMMAGEGDRGISGDFFDIIDTNNNQWVRLNHVVNQPDNFFNSSIFTANNPRNPNHINNYGLDISMFNIPNFGNSIIANNQTSTRFRYGTSRDTYIIFFIAMAVDAYLPDIEPMHQITQINGLPYDPNAPIAVEPGQEIEFALEIRNRETEPINNFSVTIPLSFATEYVGSLAEYFFGLSGPQPYLDTSKPGAETIVWNLGSLPLPPNPDQLLARLTYTLRVTQDCFVLANQNCQPSVSMQGTMSGIGQISQIPFSNQPFIQGYIDGGNCEDEPISQPLIIQINRQQFIAANCIPLENYQSKTFNYCRGGSAIVPFSTVASEFMPGTRFYSSIDPDTGLPDFSAIEFTQSNSFPTTIGQNFYFAKPKGESDCWWPIEINVFNSTTTNNAPQTNCFGEILELTHQTTDILSLGTVTGMPSGINVSLVGNTVVLNGASGQSGRFNYTINLITPCENIPQISATGTIIIQDEVRGGIIGKNQSWCPNHLPDTIKSIQDGFGSGEVSYIWGYSELENAPGFITIPGATSTSYFPGALSTTTRFWRTTLSLQNGVLCSSRPTEPVHIRYHDPITLTNVNIDHVHCKAPIGSGAIRFEIKEGPDPPFAILWSTGTTHQELKAVKPGQYSVTITYANGCIFNEEFSVEYLDEDCTVFIPEGFSPNNDGINETWILRNLTSEHPDNIVRVYNRQGTLVYEESPFASGWDGRPNRGNVLVGKNEKVPPGTYFYQIWFHPDGKPISGYVFVSY